MNPVIIVHQVEKSFFFVLVFSGLNTSWGSPKASHIKASQPHFPRFVSAFSAFSAFSLCGIPSDPYFSGVRGTVRIFRIFAISGSNR